ncbi:hypothetical protein KCU98_g253, partial [Aureobasidium melanogenum]
MSNEIEWRFECFAVTALRYRWESTPLSSIAWAIWIICVRCENPAFRCNADPSLPEPSMYSRGKGSQQNKCQQLDLRLERASLTELIAPHRELHCLVERKDLETRSHAGADAPTRRKPDFQFLLHELRRQPIVTPRAPFPWDFAKPDINHSATLERLATRAKRRRRRPARPQPLDVLECSRARSPVSGYNPYASGHGHRGDGMQQMDMSANGQIMTQGAMDAMAGQSLDDIVSQNAKLMRRQSMPQVYHPGQQQQQQPQATQPMDTDDPRRMSMMEFTGTSPTGPLESYQFNLPNSDMVDATAYMAASQSNPSNLVRQSSAGGGDLAIDNGFASASSFMPMMPPTSSYQSPANLSNIDMDLNSPYINTPMHMSSLGYNSPSIDRPMPMYNHPSYHHGMMASPLHTSVPNHMYTQSPEAGGNPNPSKRPSLENSQSRSSTSQNMQNTHQQTKGSIPVSGRNRKIPNLDIVHPTRQNITRIIKASIGLHQKADGHPQ